MIAFEIAAQIHMLGDGSSPDEKEPKLEQRVYASESGGYETSVGLFGEAVASVPRPHPPCIGHEWQQLPGLTTAVVLPCLARACKLLLCPCNGAPLGVQVIDVGRSARFSESNEETIQT